MIKVKDGYAKLIGTTYSGSADRVLLSNGGDKAVSDFAAASALGDYVTLATAQTITGVKTFASIIHINSGNSITDEGGNGVLGVKATTWTGVPSDGTAISLGTLNNSLYFRSSGDTMYHYRSDKGAAYKVLDASNYNYYSPTLTGGGASGTWGINITGSASSADVWDGKHFVKSYNEASDIDWSSLIWSANANCTDITSMSYAALMNVGTDLYRGWQIWNSRNDPRLYWRPAKGDASGWADVRVLLDNYNYTTYLGYIGTTAVQSSSAAQALTGISRISNSTTANLYLGNSGNQGWVMTQDICSHSGSSSWAINVNGYSWFKQVNIGYTYTNTGDQAFNVKGNASITGDIIAGRVIIHDGTNSRLILKTASAGANASLSGYDTGGAYGADVVLNSGSALVLGAGESASAMYSNNVDSLQGSENLYLSADGYVKIFTNCDTIANRKQVAHFDTSGYAYFGSYINIGGHEKNASSPTYVWGSNDTDSFLRSYKTSSLSVKHASTSDYTNQAKSLEYKGLPSSTSNATNTVWCKFARITYNTSAWCNAAGYFIFSGRESTDHAGILSYHFRAGSTATTNSIAVLEWLVKNRDTATVIAEKVDDNVYDLYINNYSSYTCPIIYHMTAQPDRFAWNVGSWTTTKPTAAFTSRDSGRVNYATTSTITGDGTITLLPQYGNEINIGGTAAAEKIYIGYRASGSNPIPTSFVFGGSSGSASITASKFIKSGGTEAQLLRADGGVATFNWSGQSGQPTWLWGGNDKNSYYVYNPANFNVNSAITSTVLLTNNTSQAADACYSEDPGLRFWRFNGTGNTAGGGDGWIMSWSWNPGSVGGQIYLDDNPSKIMAIRGFDNATKTFNSWSTFLHSSNYTDYTVKKDGTGASGTWGINISGTAANANTLDNIDSTGFLRQVVVANNTTNDFNTFENMTLTGRGDPTTGASLKNAPWSGSGPAGGYGVLTYLWSGYGTQMAWGYNSNRIYIRPKYYSSGSVWSSTWDSLALTSDLKNPTDYYWANVQISDKSNSSTSPTFANATTTGLLTVSTGGSHCGIKAGSTYINSINSDLILQNNGAIRFGTDSWDYNCWAGLKYVHSSKTISLGLADGTHFTANAAQSGGTMQFPGIGTFRLNGTVHINPPSGSYVEGIRMHPSSAGWTALVFCGDDNTADSGTSAKTWGLFTNGGNFYINKNNSNISTGYELCNVSGNWGIGTIDPSQKLSVNGAIYTMQPSTNRRAGIIGTYDPNRAAAIWSMGSSYQIAADGTTLGNLYGAAYVYYGSGYTFGAGYSGGHSFVWAQNGTPTAALGNNIWTSGVLETGSYLTFGYTGASFTSDIRSTWRQSLYGNTTNYSRFRTVRTDVTIDDFSEIYGSGITWATADTQGYLSVSYSSGKAFIGGGNSNKLNWSYQLLHSGNYTSYALPSEQVSQEQNTDAYTWIRKYALTDGKLRSHVYNTHSLEWSYWIGMSTSKAYGSILRTSYGNGTPRIQVMGLSKGTWSSWREVVFSDNTVSLIRIPESTDVNNLTDNALYHSYTDSNTGTLSNRPFDGSFMMLQALCYNDSAGDIRRPRIAIDGYGNAKLFNDRDTSGNGGTWYNVLTNSNYSGYVDGRYLRWGGTNANVAAMTWGTLTTSNGYTILSHASSSDGGDMGFCNKSGQIFMQLDGYYYQNEGQYRVTDVSETVTALGTSGNYLTWTKNGSTNNITVPYSTTSGSSTVWNRTWSRGNDFNLDLSLYHNQTRVFMVDSTTSNHPTGTRAGFMIAHSWDWGGGGALLYQDFDSDYGRLYTNSKQCDATSYTGWKKVAWTSDIPTSLPANGGNADTVDNVHLEWAGSQAASSTEWLAGWTANGTKIKAVKRADLSVNNLNRLSGGFSVSGAGWYKLAYIKSTDARGSVRLALITTGGNYTPRYTELKVSNGWSTIVFNQNGKFDWISKYRYTTDSTYSYIEAYFTGACDITLYTFSGTGYVDDSYSGWQVYSSATAGSGTVAETYDHLTSSSLYTSGHFHTPSNAYAAHFYENSDINLKTNIKAILDSDNIPQIKEFDWKSDGTHSYGLIAQELEEQGYSELVSDNGSHKTVNYSAALSLIVGKLQNKIKELEAEIENLKLRA